MQATYFYIHAVYGCYMMLIPFVTKPNDKVLAKFRGVTLSTICTLEVHRNERKHTAQKHQQTLLTHN